jgi:hypothetical protein
MMSLSFMNLCFSKESPGLCHQKYSQQSGSFKLGGCACAQNPFVTQKELDALQAYLDNGGTVITDQVSLGRNEYGNTLSFINPGYRLINYCQLACQYERRGLEHNGQKGHLPEVEVTETNTGGHKGCAWRAVRNEAGNIVLSVTNKGKTDASLEINLKNALRGTHCTDLLTGNPVTNKPTLKPYEVYFVEITDEYQRFRRRILNKKPSKKMMWHTCFLILQMENLQLR